MPESHIIIDIPESSLTDDKTLLPEEIKKQFDVIQNDIKSGASEYSNSTWFFFFLKYGRFLFSPEIGIDKEKSIAAYFKKCLNLLSVGGGHTVGYNFYKDCLRNTDSKDIAGIKFRRIEKIIIDAIDGPLQQISYGAPGTGKSKGVNDTASKLPEEDVIRTTFHPDSDYSTFVGVYKPKMERVPRVAMDGTTVKKATFDSTLTNEDRSRLEIEKRISYEFVPQAFTKAYVQAWKRMAAPTADGKVAPVMLVIEEINRGDCAKIFGDLFQLLDRRLVDDPSNPAKKVGFSEYPVLADSDLADYIRGAFPKAEKDAVTAAGYESLASNKHLELMLPPNLYIWATMNTSDQSLFPMDSAFKRRWDWKYVPIKNHREMNWVLEIDSTHKYDWWDFLTKINKEVFHATNSEDKQLGYFFVKPENNVVSLDMFVNKVMFYLWNVVFKDCYTECKFLADGNDYLVFTSFFDEDGNPIADKAIKMLDALKVGKWGTGATATAETENSTAATTTSTSVAT